jgi:hypothetical protein
VQLVFKPGVPVDVQKVVRAFCRKVRGVVRIDHEIDIIIIPCGLAGAVEQYLSHGGFVVVGSRPTVIVGGRPDSEYNYTVDGIIDTIAHELVHYEQWRDGREQTERGVKVRARSIMKKCGVVWDG